MAQPTTPATNPTCLDNTDQDVKTSGSRIVEAPRNKGSAIPRSGSDYQISSSTSDAVHHLSSAIQTDSKAPSPETVRRKRLSVSIRTSIGVWSGTDSPSNRERTDHKIDLSRLKSTDIPPYIREHGETLTEEEWKQFDLLEINKLPFTERVELFGADSTYRKLSPNRQYIFSDEHYIYSIQQGKKPFNLKTLGDFPRTLAAEIPASILQLQKSSDLIAFLCLYGDEVKDEALPTLLFHVETSRYHILSPEVICRAEQQEPALFSQKPELVREAHERKKIREEIRRDYQAFAAKNSTEPHILAPFYKTFCKWDEERSSLAMNRSKYEEALTMDEPIVAALSNLAVYGQVIASFNKLKPFNRKFPIEDAAKTLISFPDPKCRTFSPSGDAWLHQEKSGCELRLGSLFPKKFNGQQSKRIGDPIADDARFEHLIAEGKQLILLSCADGCGLGAEPLQAARSGNKIFLGSLKKNLRHHRPVNAYMKALAKAESAVKLTGSTTTHLGLAGLIQKTKNEGTFFSGSIGDMALLIYNKQNGRCRTLINGAAQKSRLKRNDSEGKLGKYRSDHSNLKDLHFLSFQVEANDIIIALSNGISENLAPWTHGIAPNQISAETTLETWDGSAESEALHNRGTEEVLARIIEESIKEKQSISQSIAAYCEKNTHNKRIWMEQCPDQREPVLGEVKELNGVQCPMLGVLDHAMAAVIKLEDFFTQ